MGIIRGWNRALKAIILWFVQKNSVKVNKRIDPTINISLRKMFGRSHRKPLFSDNSFGFRPNRSAHDAIKEVQRYAEEGYRYCVGLDLERFFDTVNHSKLIQVLSETIKDGRVVSLIHKYLNAGTMVRHKYEESIEGVPQGGPLSPILSNILLNELDKELERRGHPFVRYADDCIVLVKSLRATERVRDSIANYVEKELFLKVNKEKTVMGTLAGKKFLGYSFY